MPVHSVHVPLSSKASWIRLMTWLLLICLHICCCLLVPHVLLTPAHLSPSPAGPPTPLPLHTLLPWLPSKPQLNLYFLATLRGMQDLSSLTSDETHAPLQWKRRVQSPGNSLTVFLVICFIFVASIMSPLSFLIVVFLCEFFFCL